jgi:hypothetical protein
MENVSELWKYHLIFPLSIFYSFILKNGDRNIFFFIKVIQYDILIFIFQS